MINYNFKNGIKTLNHGFKKVILKNFEIPFFLILYNYKYNFSTNEWKNVRKRNFKNFIQEVLFKK